MALAFGLAGALTGCNDSFMDRYPETSITEESFNLLRDRVGMPHAQLADWLANIDPVQQQRYSNATSSQLGAVLEVRR